MAVGSARLDPDRCANAPTPLGLLHLFHLLLPPLLRRTSLRIMPLERLYYKNPSGGACDRAYTYWCCVRAAGCRDASDTVGSSPLVCKEGRLRFEGLQARAGRTHLLLGLVDFEFFLDLVEALLVAPAVLLQHLHLNHSGTCNISCG